MGRFTGILGLITMLGLAYIFSTNRKAIRLKTVGWGLGLQVAFAIFVLKIEFGRMLFQKAGDGVNWLLSFAFVGLFSAFTTYHGACFMSVTANISSFAREYSAQRRRDSRSIGLNFQRFVGSFMRS